MMWQTRHVWDRVRLSPETDCWLWGGTVYSTGYGMMHVDGKHQYAHRVAWEIFNGAQIPDNMQVRHACDNRLCVNPAHLLLGTPKDNSRDMVNRNRQSRGEDRPAAKLTEDQARAIIAFRGASTSTELAARYQVSTATIRDIHSGRLWSYLHKSA